jgi:hypothetical protein
MTLLLEASRLPGAFLALLLLLLCQQLSSGSKLADEPFIGWAGETYKPGVKVSSA